MFGCVWKAAQAQSQTVSQNRWQPYKVLERQRKTRSEDDSVRFYIFISHFHSTEWVEAMFVFFRRRYIPSFGCIEFGRRVGFRALYKVLRCFYMCTILQFYCLHLRWVAGNTGKTGNRFNTLPAWLNRANALCDWFNYIRVRKTIGKYYTF